MLLLILWTVFETVPAGREKDLGAKTVGAVDLWEFPALRNVGTEASVADSLLFGCVTVATKAGITCEHGETLGKSLNTLLEGGVSRVASLPVRD